MSILVVGTLDTKGPEVAYLRDRLHALGLRTLVVDAGILGEPLGIVPDVSHEEVARRGGESLAALRRAESRGAAVRVMARGLRAVAASLHEAGEIEGGVAMGGAEGAVLGAAALLELPVGAPKVLVSPIASGRHFFGPLVGTRDMMVVHSVVDILGLNPIACTVFDNVAAALAGMLEHGHPLPAPEARGRYVAVTMLGNTTNAVMALRDRLRDAGFEAVVFHSNGVGGRAMEELAEAGQFVGVIDFTTNEIYDPLVGGIHDGGPRRLEVVGELGMPQVVVPGCIDFSVWNAGTVPAALGGRPVYDHNPEFVLVRADRAEMEQLGHIMARKLNGATGPTRVVVPTGGLSIPNVPGGVFWDPAADAGFLRALRRDLRPDVPVTTRPQHVNDPDFGRHVAEVFLELVDASAAPAASDASDATRAPDASDAPGAPDASDASDASDAPGAPPNAPGEGAS